MTKKAKRAPDGAGSVYQRKDGSWAAALRVGYQDGRPARVTVYGKDPDEVLKKLDEVRSRVRAGSHRSTAAKHSRNTWKAGSRIPCLAR